MMMMIIPPGAKLNHHRMQRVQHDFCACLILCGNDDPASDEDSMNRTKKGRREGEGARGPMVWKGKSPSHGTLEVVMLPGDKFWDCPLCPSSSRGQPAKMPGQGGKRFPQVRASSARSLHSLPAAPFAGSPVNGRAEEAGGGSSPAPGRRPRHPSSALKYFPLRGSPPERVPWWPLPVQ